MTKDNFWEQFASSFEERNNYVVGEENMEIFLNRVYKEQDLGNTLELACGAGTYTNILIKNAENIIATDISQDMLNACEKRFKDIKNIGFQVADSFNLPFEDNSFDTVFMANLLHVIPKATKVVDETKRVLKKAAKIIILDVTMANMSFTNKMKLKERYEETYGKANEEDNYPFKIEDITKYLSENGFEVKDSEFIGNTVNAIFIVAEKV